MAIIHKKIKKNLNTDLKCETCLKSIKINEPYYIWVNNVPNLLEEHEKGGNICENCYLRNQGFSRCEELGGVETQAIFHQSIPNISKNLRLQKLYDRYLEYSKISLTEKNKKIIGIFPEEFWSNLGVTVQDVILYADFLVDRGLSLRTVLNNKKDKWLTENAFNIIKKIQEVTKYGGELSSDSCFMYGVREINSGELLNLGLKMFNSLSEDKKKIQKNYYEIKMWAEVVSNGLAELSGFYKPAVIPPPFDDFVRQVGLLHYVEWIRGLQSDKKLPIWAENNYPVLLSINLSF